MGGKDRSGGALEDSRREMQKAAQGDRRAFDRVAEAYANMVIALAYRMLGSRDEALDCAQDAFVKAWQNADRYNPKWSVATWLRRITKNLAVDRLRKRRRLTHFPEGLEEQHPDSGSGPEEHLRRKERAEIVREKLEALPEKYRAVLIMREMEGLEISEIARVTDAKPATVRWRLHRARSLFRDRWSSE